MADDIIKLIDVVTWFNQQVWVKLKSATGNIYSNDGTTNLSGDMDADGVNNSTLRTAGMPKMTNTAWVGVNTTAKNQKITKTYALPLQHLQTIDSNNDGNADKRMFFTLKWSDIAKTSSGQDIEADKLYEACIAVLRQLIYIRPLRTTWQHDGDAKFTVAYNYYGIYKDSRSPELERTSDGKPAIDSGRHTDGLPQGSFYEWSGYTKGADLSIFSALDGNAPANSVVQRENCIPGQLIVKTRLTSEINNFWKGWEDKCKDNNRFTYTYHTCHLSCHSSCHCHSSRHRR